MMRKGRSENPGYPDETYFDHVIFNLDPVTFGADENTGAVPAIGGTVDGHDLGLVFQAFAQDIAKARAAGLAVILGMHATCASPFEAQKEREFWGAKMSQPWQSSTRLFPGPYKVDLYTKGRASNYQPIDGNHRLPTFWKTFLTRLGGVYGSGFDSNFMVRIGGESLSFDHTNFNLASAPHIPGFNWDIVQVNNNDALNLAQFNIWKAHATADYWKLELITAREIWSMPGMDDVRLIVGPGEPWPDNFSSTYLRGTLGTLANLGPFTYTPYLVPDLQGHAFPPSQITKWADFVYSMHMYAPFQYTHWDKFTDLAPKENIRYEGNSDAYTPMGPNEAGSRSWEGPPPPIGTPGGFQPPFRYSGYVRRVLDDPNNDALKPAFNVWMENYSFPPVIVTEFGVLDRGYIAPEGVYIDPGEGGGGLGSLERNNHDRYRARWHWDVRNYLEKRGIGWSCWESFGGWNVYNGSLEKKEWTGIWSFHPNDRFEPLGLPRLQETDYPQFHPLMHGALFGDRP